MVGVPGKSACGWGGDARWWGDVERAGDSCSAAGRGQGDLPSSAQGLEEGGQACGGVGGEEDSGSPCHWTGPTLHAPLLPAECLCPTSPAHYWSPQLPPLTPCSPHSWIHVLPWQPPGS